MSQKKGRLDLSGVFPPIPTPFKDSEDIDYEGLRKNFEIWNEIPFRGYVVQGSNGEYVYLSREEKLEVVRFAKKMTAGRDKLIIAGSGCESTKDTVLLSNDMASAGADAVLVVTPCYYKNGMTSEALYEHYTKVADQSRAPVILYSVPSNTGIDLDLNLVAKLSQHPNIIGIKESGGDLTKITDILYKVRNEDFQVIAGSSGFLYPALTVGCVGGICALANTLGKEVCQLYQLFEERKHSEAKLLQQRLVAPNSAVTRRYGVPGLKLSMDWFGLVGGSTRLPLKNLTPADGDKCRQAFVDSGFLG